MSDESLIEAMHDDLYRLLTRLGIDDLTALREVGEMCEDLQRRFGGRDHYVPTHDKTTRNARIRAELAAGRKPTEIAQQYGMHPKTIEKIRRAKDNNAAAFGFGSEDWVL